jgi:hypothetical protein
MDWQIEGWRDGSQIRIAATGRDWPSQSFLAILHDDRATGLCRWRLNEFCRIRSSQATSVGEFANLPASASFSDYRAGKGQEMAQRRGGMVKGAIDDIRGFHRIGLQSLEAFPDRLPVGQGHKLETAVGFNRDMVEKAGRFAQEFSRQDLNALCRKIEHGGFPLGVQHVVRLMRVKGQRQRWGFLQKTINDQWSCRDLSAAIQQKTGRRPIGGRTPVIENREGAILKLLTTCEQWRRLHGVIMGNKNGDEAVELNLSPAVRNGLKTCDSAVDRLYRRLLRAR